MKKLFFVIVCSAFMCSYAADSKRNILALDQQMQNFEEVASSRNKKCKELNCDLIRDVEDCLTFLKSEKSFLFPSLLTKVLAGVCCVPALYFLKQSNGVSLIVAILMILRAYQNDEALSRLEPEIKKLEKLLELRKKAFELNMCKQ